MYSALGLSAIVFVSHGLLLHGWEVQKHRMGLVWMGRMGALNLIGAVIYATRVSLFGPDLGYILTTFRYQKDGIRESMIYVEQAIRYYTSWSS